MRKWITGGAALVLAATLDTSVSTTPRRPCSLA